MSNEVFECLYKKFENMIKVFVKKYKGLLEEEDVRQCCCIAIVKAHKTYKDNRNTKFSNWVYSNMDWECLRQIRGIKHQDRDCISLQTPLFDAEGKEITLEDTLVDDNVDIEAEIEDKLMIQTYKDEIEKYLDDDKSNICILRWIENCSYEFICNNLGVTNSKISSILMTSRMRLITHSKLFNEEFKKIHGISEYRTESAVIM